MLAVNSGKRWRSRASHLLVLTGVAFLGGCGEGRQGQSDEHEQPDYTAALLRAFDALCVGTRFDEKAFHASVSLFGDAAPISDDDLQMMSPSHTAGYYLSDGEGGPIAATIGLSRADDIESRNCGITTSIGFDDAKTLVSQRFSVTLVDQFHQGANEFALFQGNLVGYAGNTAISVQGGYELVTVSIFELPEE